MKLQRIKAIVGKSSAPTAMGSCRGKWQAFPLVENLKSNDGDPEKGFMQVIAILTFTWRRTVFVRVTQGNRNMYINIRGGKYEYASVGEEKTVRLLSDCVSHSSSWVGCACVDAVLALTVMP